MGRFLLASGGLLALSACTSDPCLQYRWSWTPLEQQPARPSGVSRQSLWAACLGLQSALLRVVRPAGPRGWRPLNLRPSRLTRRARPWRRIRTPSLRRIRSHHRRRLTVPSRRIILAPFHEGWPARSSLG